MAVQHIAEILCVANCVTLAEFKTTKVAKKHIKKNKETSIPYWVKATGNGYEILLEYTQEIAGGNASTCLICANAIRELWDYTNLNQRYEFLVKFTEIYDEFFADGAKHVVTFTPEQLDQYNGAAAEEIVAGMIVDLDKAYTKAHAVIATTGADDDVAGAKKATAAVDQVIFCALAKAYRDFRETGVVKKSDNLQFDNWIKKSGKGYNKFLKYTKETAGGNVHACLLCHNVIFEMWDNTGLIERYELLAQFVEMYEEFFIRGAKYEIVFTTEDIEIFGEVVQDNLKDAYDKAYATIVG